MRWLPWSEKPACSSNVDIHRTPTALDSAIGSKYCVESSAGPPPYMEAICKMLAVHVLGERPLIPTLGPPTILKIAYVEGCDPLPPIRLIAKSGECAWFHYGVADPRLPGMFANWKAGTPMYPDKDIPVVVTIEVSNPTMEDNLQIQVESAALVQSGYNCNLIFLCKGDHNFASPVMSHRDIGLSTVYLNVPTREELGRYLSAWLRVTWDTLNVALDGEPAYISDVPEYIYPKKMSHDDRISREIAKTQLRTCGRLMQWEEDILNAAVGYGWSFVESWLQAVVLSGREWDTFLHLAEKTMFRGQQRPKQLGPLDPHSLFPHFHRHFAGEFTALEMPSAPEPQEIKRPEKKKKGNRATPQRASKRSRAKESEDDSPAESPNLMSSFLGRTGDVKKSRP